MASYYSTFSSGLQEVVKSALIQQLDDVKLDLLLDGLVVYRSEKPIKQINRIRFFNNTFLLLHMFKSLGDNGIPFMINNIFKKPELINIPRPAIKGSAFFRIMASKENQTVSINREILARLESFFSHKLSLRVNRSKPDVEVWFLTRSEGYGFVGIRIMHTSHSEKNLQRGELKSELANILCLISEPAKDDVFLDPFAGSGAIPIERSQIFPSKQIIANENDKEIVNRLRTRISGMKLNITIGELNALNLVIFKDNSIGKIVTDPPWGIYKSQELNTLEKLYTDMMLEFNRVLKENGLLVILMGQKELFEKVLKEIPTMVLDEKYDILVSGKKAAIYKIKKQTPLLS